MKETKVPTYEKDEVSIDSLHDGLCERCLSTTNSHYVDFNGRTICKECFQFGLSTNENSLYRHTRKTMQKNHKLEIGYKLSEDQRKGSRFFVDCLQNRQNGFLEAVCGAGKTEMLFQGFLESLNRGKLICFAIPRKQIVIQIEARLKSVFPDSIVKGIHGDSKDDEGAHIVVSTIQQLISYYHEFDVLVVDEVDAFPLEGNRMYHRFIKKAMKPDGILFLMSATKVDSIHEYLQEFNMAECVIYRKFHNIPQDIPICRHVPGLYRKFNNGIIPNTVLQTLRKWVLEGSKVFIFVPTIRLAEMVFESIHKTLFYSEKMTSLTYEKKEILKRFETEETKILISTSVLERGVTFSKLNVMVLFSNHRIYSKEMLIQIAGRVGRKLDSPRGEIIFLSENISKEMIEAISAINHNNLLAGFLE